MSDGQWCNGGLWRIPEALDAVPYCTTDCLQMSVEGVELVFIEGQSRGTQQALRQLTYAHTKGTAKVAERDPRTGVSTMIHGGSARCAMMALGVAGGTFTTTQRPGRQLGLSGRRMIGVT